MPAWVRPVASASFSEQITPADKYPRIFPSQMEAIVYISNKREWTELLIIKETPKI